MSLHAWWLYFGSVFLICAVPGPNMLHVMARSARLGIARSIPAMVGCLLALELMLSASAIGLGAVLMARPHLFGAIRYAGAAYLLYLGIRSWLGRETGSPARLGEVNAERVDGGRIDPNGRVAARTVFRGGLLVGLTNPKAILFAAAFLPQFIEPGQPHGPQLVLLVATFAATEMFWYGRYAIGGQALAGHLARPVYRRLFDRVTGGLFMSFGLALIRTRI